MAINPIAVNGVTKENRQSLLRNLPTDFTYKGVEMSEIFLKAEPENPYDQKAVAVYDRMGNKLGYVPANEPQRDDILRALGNGFVTAAAIKVGGTDAKPTLGLRFRYHSKDAMFGYAEFLKDEDEEIPVPVKVSGKRHGNRYELNKAHKINDLRVLTETTNNPKRAKQYKRILTHKNRRKFNACIDSVDRWNEYKYWTEDDLIRYKMMRYNKRMSSKVGEEELTEMERKLGIVKISA